jgi:hypothetical protein
MIEITIMKIGRQEEIGSPKCPHFPAKVADFGLKPCIRWENSKDSTSARNPHIIQHSLSIFVSCGTRK